MMSFWSVLLWPWNIVTGATINLKISIIVNQTNVAWNLFHFDFGVVAIETKTFALASIVGRIFTFFFMKIWYPKKGRKPFWIMVIVKLAIVFIMLFKINKFYKVRKYYRGCCIQNLNSTPSDWIVVAVV